MVKKDFLEIQGLLNQAYYFFIGKNAGTPDVLRQIPGVGDAAIAQYQNIGKSKGQYSEFLAWIRKENTTEGDIIRVETAGFEYWMFTTDKDEMVLRMDTADRLFDGNEVEAARYLGSRKSAA